MKTTTHTPRTLALLLAFSLLPAVVPHIAAQNIAEPAPARDEDVVVLDEFKVTTTSAQDTYMTSDVASGARVASKAIETPYSVQVMTSEFINDFQLFELADQLRFISGAAPGAEDTGANNGKRIRGFQPLVMRDGFSRANPPDRSVVDRVEVIRGPVSMLYGQSSPGGMINYVSKRPKKKPAYSLTATYGPDYNFQRVALDATGPIIPGKLFYYANYAYNYNESDLDFFYIEKNLYAAGLSWQIAPATLLTVSWESQRITSNQGDAIPMLRQGTGIYVDTYWELGRFNYFGPDSKLHRNFDSLNALLEHRFTKNLSARLNLQWYGKTFDQNKTRLAGGTIAFAKNTPNFGQFTRLKQDEYAYLAQADVVYKFNTGPARHMLLLAGDATFYDFRQLFNIRPEDNYGQNVFEVNPWNPVWIKRPATSSITKTWQDTDRKIDYYGLFASWRGFFFNDKLVTLAGVRYDLVDQQKMFYGDYQKTASQQITDGSGSDDNSLTYTIGANWKIFNDTAVLYANNSTGFEPVVTIDRGTGQVMPNEKSLGFEAGIKGSVFGDQLGYTLSLFTVEKTDVAIASGLAGAGENGIPQYVGAGKEQGRGVELDLKWNISPAFFVQAGGSYIDAKTTEPVASRNRLLKAPRTNGYVATRYVFRNGTLKGLKLGANVTYTGNYLYHAGTVNASGVTTRFRQVNPGTTLYNAFIGYSFATKSPAKLRHSVTLNLLNLFDKDYLQDTYRLGRGREIRLTYTVSY